MYFFFFYIFLNINWVQNIKKHYWWKTFKQILWSSLEPHGFYHIFSLIFVLSFLALFPFWAKWKYNNIVHQNDHIDYCMKIVTFLNNNNHNPLLHSTFLNDDYPLKKYVAIFSKFSLRCSSVRLRRMRYIGQGCRFFLVVGRFVCGCICQWFNSGCKMLLKVSVLVIYILIPVAKVCEGKGKFEILLMLRCENFLFSSIFWFHVSKSVNEKNSIDVALLEL